MSISPFFLTVKEECYKIIPSFFTIKEGSTSHLGILQILYNSYIFGTHKRIRF